MSEIETEKEFEESKKIVEEMMAEFTRAELNNMAEDYGLNPEDYPNKRTMAYAIYEARAEDAPSVEEAGEFVETKKGAEEEASKESREEVAGEHIKLSNSTVRGKINSIMEKSKEFDDYAFSMMAKGQEELQTGIKNFNESLEAFQGSILEMTKGFEDYANIDFKEAMQAFNEAKQAFQASIMQLMKEFEDYKNIDFKEAMQAFNEAMQAFQASIMGMTKSFEEYKNTDFKEGIDGFHRSVNIFNDGINEFRQEIVQHSQETHGYIQKFYG